MPSSLISPALFARDKALLKLPAGQKDCSVGTGGAKLLLVGQDIAELPCI